MNKIKILIAAIAAIFSCNVFAQKVTVDDISATPNGTANLVIKLQATEAAQAGQMNITLPDGVAFEEEDGEYNFTRGDLVQRDRDVDIRQKTSYMQLLIYNTQQKIFKAASGTLITIPLTIGNVEDGTYEIKISNIKFSLHGQYLAGSHADGTLDPVTVKLTVSSTTGINTIEADKLAKAGKVYNLQGQRVSSTKQGGLYIVDGKKVVVK